VGGQTTLRSPTRNSGALAPPVPPVIYAPGPTPGSRVVFGRGRGTCPVTAASFATENAPFDFKSNKKDGYRQLNVRQLGSLRPWDHRGICYMDRKRIQCLSNASQHVHIYLQPFTSYSEILVGNRNFFLPTLAFNAPVRSGRWDNRGKCHTVGKRIQCL